MSTGLHTVVVGTGLLGASLAAAGRRAGVFSHVTGVGRSPENLATALERDLVDAVSTDLASAVAEAELVVLATPVNTAVAQLAEVAKAAPAGAIITDVGSVKGPLCRRAAELGLGPARFVGAHPMAGSEATGAAAADPALFEGATVVVIDEASSDASAASGSSDAVPGDAVPGDAVAAERPSARARLDPVWSAVGARIVVMTAAEHDRAVAAASHVPHLLAFALAVAAAERSDAGRVGEVVASGFRDMTRLALGDARMWTDIALANRSAIGEGLAELRSALAGIEAAVEGGDEAALLEWIDRAGRGRRELVGR